MLTSITLVLISLWARHLRASDLDPDVWRNATQLIDFFGYVQEQHTVVTQDGYILYVIRMWSKSPDCPQRRIPVVIQHGIICGPENLLAVGPPNGLPYYFADRYYDVWMPVGRGSTYSKRHLNYSTDDPRFWNFTFEETGIYDGLAYLNYIRTVTGFPRVHFLAHSQGATQMLAALTIRPEEFRERLFSFVAVGPATRLLGPNLIVRFLKVTGYLDLLEAFGVYEFAPSMRMLSLGLSILDSLIPSIGDTVFQLVSDYYTEGYNHTRSPVFLSHYPQGSSTKSMRHMTQLLDSDGFYKYREKPTDPRVPYDFSRIPNLPIAILGGEGDLMASAETIVWLHTELLRAGKPNFMRIYPYMGHLGAINPSSEHIGHLQDAFAFFKSVESDYYHGNVY